MVGIPKGWRRVLGRSSTAVLSSEPVLTLALGQQTEHTETHRDFVFWLQSPNGFCLNPSVDLLFPGREGAAALLLYTNASTFTSLQMATISLCFGPPREAPGSTLKGCQVLHKGSCIPGQ